MISVTDFRSGTIFLEDGRLYKVVEYRHQKIARGSGKIIVKVRDLESGAIVRKTYQSGTKVGEVRLDTVEGQYLYRVGIRYNFMNNSDYSQFEVDQSIVGERGVFLKDGLVVKLRSYEGKIVDLELPIKVEYRVVEAPPDIRGNTSQGGTKEVVLEGGLKVNVPMFIKKSDVVRVDTRSGEYVERVL
jgi:elongation factor P